jgi:hypothetical protein
MVPLSLTPVPTKPRFPCRADSRIEVTCRRTLSRPRLQQLTDRVHSFTLPVFSLK